MGKRLAVFCDGTWSTLSEAEKKGATAKPRAETNVALLYRAVREVQTGSDGQAQEAEFFSGVGVGRDSISGGLSGKGLDLKVLEAYRWLSGKFEIGDQVFLIGFSRGAYTVRSLAGLVRTVGYLAGADEALFTKAMALYRKRNKVGGADAREVKAFREQNAKAWVEPDAEGRLHLIDGLTRDSQPHAIQFLGVWDTVGALGVPEGFPFARRLNAKHRFHDTSLSRVIAHAAHALAADERRKPFEVAAWTNLETLNAGLTEPRYRQVWFAGDHGSVGGGGAERRLSSVGLLWMAERMAAAGYGIDFAHPILREAKETADPLEGPLANTAPTLADALLAKQDRKAMLPADGVHESAIARMKANARYRPRPLKPVWPAKTKGSKRAQQV